MSPADIAAKLATLAKEREQLLVNFNFQLGVLAGREAELKEMLKPQGKEPEK